MLHRLLSSLDRYRPFSVASAHCDIPCGIYDPHTALINALTVVRVLDLIQALSEKATLTLADQAQLARLVAEKETHALRVKDEVRIIWGDYFKQLQFEQVEGVHDLVHRIMLQGSKCKQNIDREHGIELVNLVNQFAEAFWKTKNVSTYRATCLYAPSLDVVYPDLKAA